MTESETGGTADGTAPQPNNPRTDPLALTSSPPRLLLHSGLPFLAASLLFLCSGATGLAYEVIWFKRFANVWGSSSLALAAVLASFLAGLGLGAWVFGRLADRWRSPILIYGACEIAIGLLALLVPLATGALLAATSTLHEWLSPRPLVHSLVRSILTFLVLGPPCVLMGGTLPLLVRAFAPRIAALKESAGWFYAINSLGAALGSVVTGFWLLPELGLQLMNFAAAGASIAVGIAALALAWTWNGQEPAAGGLDADSRDVQPPATALDHELKSPQRLPALLAAAFLAGCAALALEVAWTRQLALILGGSTYAFCAMLSVFIAGIGLGSLVYHFFLARRSGKRFAPALTVTLLAVSVLLGKLLVPALTMLIGLLPGLRASAVADAVLCVLSSAVLELLPAVGMGILFPLLIELAAQYTRGTARTVGSLYALNTLGAIVGATAGALVLIPNLGVSWTIASATAVYAVVLLLTFPALSRWKEQALLLALLTVCLGAALFSSRSEDPRVTNAGMYLYGVNDPNLTSTELLYFRDGTSASVLVISSGGVTSLRVNGKVDASNLGDMPMQLGSAYFPLFLMPSAQNALVIGYGSGTTPGALLLKPDLRVTCAEIEPAVVEGAEHFAAVNHRPRQHEPSRFSLVYDDGRSYLQGTQERFDLIISEPSNPWMAGVASLFTREFYHVASKRLAPGGILAQWVQGYAFTVAEYALVARTLLEVFPDAALVRILDGDTLILASNEPIRLDAASCVQAQAIVDASAELRADLSLHFRSADVRALLLGHLLLDRQGLVRLVEAAGTGGINTDANLRLEFDAPLRLFRQLDSAKSVPAGVFAAARVEHFTSVVRRLGSPRELAGAVHDLALRFEARSRLDIARELFRLGLELDPKHPELLVERVVSADRDDPQSFEAAVSALVGAGKERVVAMLGLAGSRLYKAGQDARAGQVFERILTLEPGSATTWANLGNVKAALGAKEEARQALEKAAALDPLNDFVRQSLETLRKDAQPKATPNNKP